MTSKVMDKLVEIVENGNIDEIKDALDTLASMRAQKDIEIDRAGLSRIMAQVQAEIQLLTSEISTDIAALEKAIKGRVKTLQETVQGNNLQAIYSERRSWNSDWLVKYANDGHPEVNSALKTSQTVALRKR